MREHGVADGGAVGTAVMRLTNRPRRIGGSDAVERMGDASATARGGWMGGRGCSSWMDRGEVEQQQQVSEQGRVGGCGCARGVGGAPRTVALASTRAIGDELIGGYEDGGAPEPLSSWYAAAVCGSSNAVVSLTAADEVEEQQRLRCGRVWVA